MIHRIFQSLSRLSGLMLLILSISNFILAYCACSRSTSRFVEVRSDVSSSSVTNSFPFLPPVDLLHDFPTSPPPATVPSPAPATVTDPPHEVAKWRYRYFLANRRIGLEAFGRYYYEGSPCSYGRIYQIYPDRILLSNGDWITNVLQDDVAYQRKEVMHEQR